MSPLSIHGSQGPAASCWVRLQPPCFLGRKSGKQDPGLRHNSQTHHQAEAYRVPSPRGPDSPGDLYLSDCIQLFQDGILILLSKVSCQQLINLLWEEEMY